MEQEQSRAWAKLAALRHMISDKMAYLDLAIHRNRNRAFQLKMSMTGLSATTTVLIGISGKSIISELVGQILSIVALLTSAIATIIGAWDAFFSHREMWVAYTEAFHDLRRLQSEIGYSEGDITQAEVDILFQRFQIINESMDATWVGKRKDK